jgi:methyl-accepting chemotaxis protein
MLSNLSLSAKINVAATTLVVLSLAITAAVTGFEASRTAERDAMNLARTQAAAAASALQARIVRNLATVIQLGATRNHQERGARFGRPDWRRRHLGAGCAGRQGCGVRQQEA